MGKRVSNAKPTSSTIESSRQFTPPQTRTTIRRKRKHQTVVNASATKSVRLNATASAGWHANVDEDSSSSDAHQLVGASARQPSNKRANNSALLPNSARSGGGDDGNGNVNDNVEHHNTTTESPKPVYTLRPSVVNGTILNDLTRKPWRLGRPIGKGNFGEIFLASDNIAIPVTNDNAKFVVKIEPHSNGPLFVEIHCLMNTAEKKPSANGNQKQGFQSNKIHKGEELDDDEDDGNDDDNTGDVADNDDRLVPQIPPSGIPDYIASGSHYFGGVRYRFLVLPRFDRDLHSLIKNCRVQQKCLLALAIQIITVLENLHDKGYCHNDVKAQNLMISKCKYYKRKLTTQTRTPTISGINGSKAKTDLVHKKKYDDHYEEKLPTTDSGNSSEQETNDDNACDTDFVIKRNGYRYTANGDDDDDDDGDDFDDDEDFDDGATSNSNNSHSRDEYKTPISRKARLRRNIVEFSGSNPVRSCRQQKRNLIYEEMVSSHYLRPSKRVSYSEFFYEDGASVKEDSQDTNFSSGDEVEPSTIRRSSSGSVTIRARSKVANTGGSTLRLDRHQTCRQERLGKKCNRNMTAAPATAMTTTTTTVVPVEEERIFLIDFGLASKFRDNGIHRPFVMDQRRAHDGTLEFTSRDAHMGAHSRRSDLECLGYNLLYWSQGYLPWKDSAQQQQQEKVHRAKEYLMTDVRELLKQIYGKQIPKYLGEFLHEVGKLGYHDRPDYARYRRIFERECRQLGFPLNELRLDSDEIMRTSVRVKEEIENKNDVFDMSKANQKAWSIMSNISVTTPFQERTLSNRVSPKNLRSKSDKKTMKKKKFSWIEILSQDPDQIARERAEKEFDREEALSGVQHPTVRRYEGKPTYAILEIQQRLRMSGRFVDEPPPIVKATMQQQYNNKKMAVEHVGTSVANESDNEEDEDDGDDDAVGDEDMSGNDNEEDDDENEDACMEVSESSNDDEEADDQDEERMQTINLKDDDDSDVDDDDRKMESDASEMSSLAAQHTRVRHVGRPRKDASRRSETTKHCKVKNIGSYKKTTATCNYDANGVSGGTRTRRNKRANVEFTTKTRSSKSSANTISFNNNNKSNRQFKAKKKLQLTPTRLYGAGVDNNGGKKTQAASAAGEIEQSKHNNNNYRHHEQQKQLYKQRHRHHDNHGNDFNYGENVSQLKEQKKKREGLLRTLERRTRRCLIKTDVETEESNSNFSTDVRSLFNVWNEWNQH